MECNKGEAVRAREIAEKKLQERDYASAKKMALKAEKLFPQLENISQLLTVCEVHCSAQLKSNGQYDWYKILQVEPKSEEILIKKQFRKLALLLHPDKNKLPGAEAAFKLVAEANNTLSDRAKRALYDLKRPGGSQQSTKPNAAHNSSSSNFNSRNQPRPPQQPQPQPPPCFTFWTACPGCKTRHQYYSNMLSQTVRCLNCAKIFTATGPPHLNPGDSSSARNQPQQFPGQRQPQNPSSYNFTSSPGVGGTTRDSAGVSKPDSNPNPNPSKSKSSGSNTVTGQRRGKRVSADTSRSSADANPQQDPNPNPSSDVDPRRGDGEQTDCGAFAAGTNSSLRRSPRIKQDVNYNYTGAGASTPAKKARIEVKVEKVVSGSANATNTHSNASTAVEGEAREKDREKGKVKVEPSGWAENKDAASRDANDGTFPNYFAKTVSDDASLSEEDSKTRFVYPDPEFCDFDKLKDITKFGVNQIWALYDNLDAMPRFYALIRNVHTESGFKVKYTWLEHDPVNEAEITWSDKELPVGCGNYTLGDTETTDDRLMFSHMVSSEKVKKKGGSHVILPTKGEVWALFKDWDIKWSLEAEKERKYEYEVVEVLSDFSRASGVTVVPLVKVHGFVSVFVRAQDWVPIKVPHGEILRFSHSIPAYRLNGTERDDLPAGSLELDTVSLPSNFETAFRSVTIDSIKLQTPSFSFKERNVREGSAGRGCFNLSNGDIRNEQTSTQRCESPQLNADTQEVYQYPDAEFHNFTMYRTCNQFRRGQIWALYSDLDTFPKYYGYIRKVESELFKVHVSWLEACPKSGMENNWLNAEFPISCGKFKITNQNMIFDNPDAFSHVVSPRHHGRGNYYEILPEVGEIWAVYKNWSAEWTLHDFETCEFDIVEIKEQREVSTVVWPLRQVPEYRSVFMRERVDGNGSGTREISENKFIMFSHRIPANRLTEERGGKLRGFWELDPASVPDTFLYRDK